MCGIIAYLGTREAAQLILQGLCRLEYRGYDSAGIAIQCAGELTVRKEVGKVKDLMSQLGNLTGTLGIGHTRWATHGEPTVENAHPHGPEDGSFALVHNGIIENYAGLRESLISKGYKFKSETDTEVLALLIHEVASRTGLPIAEALPEALKLVHGAYGIAIVLRSEPRTLICARMGSPLILGVGEDEFFVASDAAAFMQHTRKAIYIDDGQMCIITEKGWEVKTLSNVKLLPAVVELEGSLEQIEKGGYPHFMLKEIMEQPDTLANCLRGRLLIDQNLVRLGGLEVLHSGVTPRAEGQAELPLAEQDTILNRMRNAKRIVICACGTSWHAALVGEYLIESLARINVEVEYASEFRYKEPLLNAEEDIVMVISQSGETADTLAALREAQSRGVTVVAVCNTVGSTIARESNGGVYLHAGPEIGVASTKAFTAQVAVLTMIAVAMGQGRTLSEERCASILTQLRAIPAQIKKLIADNEAKLIEIARVYRYAHHFLFLGRGYNYPVALEGALKMKEISYIHAEGYPAAEMKHGPIALIDRLMPVVCIAVRDSIYEKVKSNICEVKARQGSIISITDEGNSELDAFSDYVIQVPACDECLVPLLTTVPLQLLSYHIAIMRGCNVDQPRNLAKSVTVE
mmetsp:Transcript_2646/g.6296  ORF Transcript_2646/g.6296 Transcript_2646/m.6296 type:complete len:634 (+) Transcript_2646:42-1943(+)|eukprot:CAMPEP_0114556042 /NCGR_PEP_ID=MMETSP0114-20121206/9079_1 /TAXON_ID=31324 /ORGANISM="Goniomonas sp, Strain m" /LENGTH=633 /DNA_ID=CAMNT_0001741223 /DNA_START=28 /DNA_END=1929 /DNA_ORIENTATION=+